jgi:eukaryotic-like serine/threonine-protein kinase
MTDGRDLKDREGSPTETLPQTGQTGQSAAPGDTVRSVASGRTARPGASSTTSHPLVISPTTGGVILRLAARTYSTDASTQPGQSGRTGPTSERWDASRLPLVERGSYDVAGELAHGGIGRILKGRDQRLGRTVALKELLERGGQAEERFMREALVTARLQHPSIVPVYEAGRWPSGEPFYAMKLVSGRSLDRVIKDARTLDKRLALIPHVLAVAEAMAYAHSERIIHRDLKPSNVLVGAFGETVVIDWGLAKDLDESGTAAASVPRPMPTDEGSTREEEPASGGGESENGSGSKQPSGSQSPASGSQHGLTMAGSVMGTPAYMPPEQAKGLPVDERADVYSLGAILYHVLAGAPPFTGKSSLEILKKTLAGPPVALDRRQRGVPQDLLTIVNKAMARDPEARYPTAQELAQDLRRFQTGQIVGAHKYSRSERLLRFIRRHRAAVTVGAAAMLVLTVVAVVSVRGVVAARNRAEQERDRAEQKQVEAEAAQRDAWERADELTLAQARDLMGRDPNKALELLRSLSPVFSRWGAVRTIAADARSRGIARVLRHPGSVNDVAMSSDGSTLATSCDDKLVRLYDLRTGHIQELAGHTDEVYRIQLSEDGRHIASSGKDGTLRVWDVATGAGRVLVKDVSYLIATVDLSSFFVLRNGRLALVNGATREVRDMGPGEVGWSRYAFSRDKKKVAYATRGKLAVFDIEHGSERRFADHKVAYRSIAISTGGELVAAGDQEGSVIVWDVATGASRTFKGHPREVAHIAISPDGRWIASGGQDRTLRLWDVTSKATSSAAALVFEGHEGQVQSLVFSADSRQIVSAGTDRAVRVWDLAGREGRVLRGFDDMIYRAVLSPDGGTIAASSLDHTVRIWDLASVGGRILSVHDGPVVALGASPDGKIVASASNDGVVRVIDLTANLDRPRGTRSGPGEGVTLLRGRKAPALDLIVSPDGKRVALATEDGAVSVWPVGGGEPLVLQGHEGAVQRIAFLPDASSLISAGKDGSVRRWSLATGERKDLYKHDAGVTTLALSPNGEIVATGGDDKAVRVFELPAGREQVLRGHSLSPVSMAFSPDGKTIVTGSHDHTLRFWSLATGESAPTPVASPMWGLAYLPDGKSLLASGFFNSFQVWDVASRTMRSAYPGHTAPITDAALSPDGKRVASSSYDQTVRLVDLETSEGRALTDHTDVVSRVELLAGGRSIISAGKDGTVRLWTDDLPEDPEALRAWLKEAVPTVIDLRPEAVP